MKNTYQDLIEQTYYFPQDGFDLREGYLYFNGVSLKHLIEQYGTPFRLTYLPKVGEQIKRAKNWFRKAMRATGYRGDYYYCYCTKCNHFKHVISKALQHDAHVETSSSFDIDLIIKLFEEGKINKSHVLVHNGYKTQDYLEKIKHLNKLGFKNSIPILDSPNELERYQGLENLSKDRDSLGHGLTTTIGLLYLTARDTAVPSDGILSKQDCRQRSFSIENVALLRRFRNQGQSLLLGGISKGAEVVRGVEKNLPISEGP